ncbi:ABC transporter substrate-binding protein [Halopiger aswanensis]|uniref:Peptide/nickel transport system substrate-binding protein n=1 Tax=Halopiger aswanensis TaxID=148449 RepID=A0A3R7GIR2_9EURY|nr:ABC transporter substrate-binding protein [Halopiger aswanensis]RKD95368.1 peptide/nickel transport system substrate-binding protein [Halopiger aswanensis]
MLALLGGSATAGLAGCSALLEGDGNGDGNGNGNSSGNGNGNGGGNDYEVSEHADKAQAAWETVQENAGPDGEEARTQAYVEIEEAVRDDMVMLPLYHSKGEMFWYDRVDVPRVGALGPHQQTHNETQIEGDTELNLVTSSFDELDPIMSTDTASSEVINQMYETLVHYPNGVNEIENKLVESFETSEDGLTWTFTLKEDVTFHGGEDLTADDVVYSFRRLAESEYSERSNFLVDTPLGLGLEHEETEDGGIAPDSIGVEAVDDRTVELSLTTPQPAALDILTYTAFAVVPEGIVGDIEGYDGEVDHNEFATGMANGTGPFQFDEFNPGEEMRVVRFDDYHGSTANLESIHWEINEDPESIFTYIMEGNADIFRDSQVPTPQYDPSLIDAEEDDMGREVGTYGPLENDETVNYLGVPELGTYYFAFNVSNVPRPVRQAIAYVTDHQEFLEDVLKQRGFEAFSFTPPRMWPTGQDGYDQWVDEWQYGVNETDIESAQQVLEEAGFTADDPFELTASTYESGPEYAEMAEIIRQKLADLGVDIQNQSTQFSTLQDRGEDGDLEMYSLGWIWSWPDPAYGHFGFEPKNTDTSRMPNEATGYYLDWQVNLDEEA